MNTPYVKQYNELGELTNPIDGALRHAFPNRRARRAKKFRDWNNKSSFKMTVIGNYRFAKRIQVIGDKQILHYVECKR